MAKTKVKMNIHGCVELRKSSGVKNVLLSYANDVSERAGDGFEVEETESFDRAKYNVRAVSSKAVAKCMKGNVLLKVLGDMQ